MSVVRRLCKVFYYSLPLSLLFVFHAVSTAQTLLPTTYPMTPLRGVSLLDTSGFQAVIGSLQDDPNSAIYPIGFPFTFGGVSFSQFSLSTDGVLGLGASPISLTGRNDREWERQTQALIAPFYDDLVTDSLGYVGFTTQGISPSRRLVIEWRVKPKDDFTPQYMRFQCILTEDDAGVEFRYGENMRPSDGATIGLKSPNGSVCVRLATMRPAFNHSFSWEVTRISAGSGIRFGKEPLPLPILQTVTESRTGFSVQARFASDDPLTTAEWRLTSDFQTVRSVPAVDPTAAQGVFAGVTFSRQFDAFPYSALSAIALNVTRDALQTPTRYKAVHTPVPEENLALWLSSALGIISDNRLDEHFWFDLSGRGNDASLIKKDGAVNAVSATGYRQQSSSAHATLQRNPQRRPIVFDRDERFYRIPAEVTLSDSGMTVMMVLSPDVNFLGQEHLILSLSGQDGDIKLLRQAGTRKVMAVITKVADTPNELTVVSEEDVFEEGRQHSLTCFIERNETGNHLSLYVNGIRRVTQGFSFAFPKRFTKTEFGGGESETYRGEISELMLYERPLSKAERASIELYLANEFTIYRDQGESVTIGNELGLFDFGPSRAALLALEHRAANTGGIRVSRQPTPQQGSISGGAKTGRFFITPNRLLDIAWTLIPFEGFNAAAFSYMAAFSLSDLSAFTNPDRLVVLSFDTTLQQWMPLETARRGTLLVAEGPSRLGRIAIGTDEEVPLHVSEKRTEVNGFELHQNYPNPFNPSTLITFRIASESRLRLSVVDVLGREVATLLSERRPAGTYQIPFRAQGVASGVYFYQLRAESRDGTRVLLTKKMVLKK